MVAVSAIVAISVSHFFSLLDGIIISQGDSPAGASAGAAAAAVSVLVASVAAAGVAAAAGAAAAAPVSSVFLSSAFAAFFSLRFLKAAFSLPFRLSNAPNAAKINLGQSASSRLSP